MPKGIFEQTAKKARELVGALRSKSDVPSESPRAPRKRKHVIEICVIRNGTCVTHGNAAKQCSADRS